MNYIKFLLIFILFGFFNLFAEEEEPLFYYGVYAGYNYNMHTADFRNLGDFPNCCPLFESGTGSGFSAGLLFEYPINDKFRPYIRAGYSVLNGLLEKNEVIGNTEIRDSDGNTISITDAVSTYSVDSDISLLTIEPGINYYIIPSWKVNAGLNFGLLTNKNFDQQEELTKPKNVVFAETGQITRNVYNNELIPGVNSLQMFLALGTGYDFPIGEYSYITPEIKYHLPFTKISEEDWQVSYLQIGASATFAFVPKKEKPIIEKKIYKRDTTVIAKFNQKETEINLLTSESTTEINELEDVIKKTEIITEKYEKLINKNSRLEPNLIVRGINDDGQIQENPKILIEEFETSESFPLLTYVFFKEGSAELDNTKMKLLNPEETSSFNIDSLPENTMDIYSNMLNIVANRFKKQKRAQLIIVGTNSDEGIEKGNTELSQNRADAVKDYFVDVWGIDESKISTKARNLPENFANVNKEEGIEENRRAEIIATNLDVTAPVELKEIDKIANPPVIEIIPSVVSDSPLDNWNIDVNQSGKNIRDYNGKELNPIRWSLEEEPIPATEENINVDFAVQDELGQRKNIEKDLKIEQLTIRKKRVILKDDKIIEKFALILFDYDKAAIKDGHKKILEDIRSRIKPDSKVIISGYADETGDPDYNRKLAGRRTSEVQKILKVSDENLTINNVGSDRLLYNNNSPEGRSYCRTVTIEIETPVK